MKEKKKYFNSLTHDIYPVNGTNEFDEKLSVEAMMENADT